MNTDAKLSILIEGEGDEPMRVLRGLRRAFPDLVIVEHQRPCITNGQRRFIHVERSDNGDTEAG